MAKTRKDSKGRVLRKGESYRKKDKRYVFAYTDAQGDRHFIYSSDLLKLREKEKQLQKDTLDGIDTYLAGHATLNETFDRYMEIKTNLRRTTKTNYMYMYNKFVRPGFGTRKIGQIKYSDVKAFYSHLVEAGLMGANTVGTIHCCLHPTFEMAVKDDIIRKNPTHGVFGEVSNDLGKTKVSGMHLP